MQLKTWTRRVSWTLALLCVCWLAACNRLLDNPEAIQGEYVLNESRGRDVLVLQPAGRYVHHYEPSGGAVVVDSGDWEMDASSGEPRIVLSNYVPRWRTRNFPDIPVRPAYWSTYVVRGPSGKTWINVDADQGLRYDRQRSE